MCYTKLYMINITGSIFKRNYYLSMCISVSQKCLIMALYCASTLYLRYNVQWIPAIVFRKNDKRPQNIQFMAITEGKVTEKPVYWAPWCLSGLIQHAVYLLILLSLDYVFYFITKPSIVFIPCALWLICQEREYENENAGAMMSSSCVAFCQNKSSRRKTDFLKHTQNTHT